MNTFKAIKTPSRRAFTDIGYLAQINKENSYDKTFLCVIVKEVNV